MQQARFPFSLLSNGRMKEVQVGETDVLLARVEDEYFALYAKCTHYGAPLADGCLQGRRVVCPWHHACFDVKSGRHLEAPGLDGLARFEVKREGEEIVVSVPDRVPERVTNPMTAIDPSDRRLYVIVGGGAAAAYAAEGMRQAGYGGRIRIYTRENELPYDRPNCSKDYLADEAPEEWMPLRDSDFYKDHQIDFQQGRTVTRLNAADHSLTLDDGSTVRYDKVLLATGGRPRLLGLDGENSANVHTLRSLADSRQLRELGKAGKKAVVIGSSFIGMEGAQSLQQLDCEVHVVSPEEVPFAGVFGPEIGRFIKKAHEQSGIRFHAGRKAERLERSGDRVTTVVLDNGDRLDCDLLLVGIGVSPATDFAEGLEREEDGGFRADAFLQVGQDVYAAGDIVHYPYRDGHARIEHWKVAAQQGRVAGRNMAGAGEPYAAVPFFWTAQQGMNLRYIGHAEDYDTVEIDGSLEEKSFIAYYKKDGTTLAALGLGRDKEIAELQEKWFASPG